jgi:hypothetical protein
MMPKQLNIDSSVSAEEAQSELEAVLHSQQFERSERLQKFLRYVCELTLRGESSKLDEYLIGSEVFQRGANYSPTEVSVVRRQAHTLRQKLQEYYTSEGRDHLVRRRLPSRMAMLAEAGSFLLFLSGWALGWKTGSRGGLNTQATQIAAEFLTTEAALEQLLSGLRKVDPNRRRGCYFQAVLKTEVYDKVPTKASLVALRLL